MYSLLVCQSSRGALTVDGAGIADIIRQEILPNDNRYLQVGGNETVGMGWFAVNFN